MLPARGELDATPATPDWSSSLLFEQVRGRVRDYLHLIKARLSSMVLLSGVVGYWLAATEVDVAHLFWFTVGTFLVVGGANAFNQVVEREPDGRMERTAHRPLPRGRLSVLEAGMAASLMSAVGLAILLSKGGWLCATLALAALLIYVLVYTPLKSRSAWSTVPGAVAGAIPPLMGWSAAAGELAPLALCLFGILFFWQFPHTWAIAATYREDYARVGYRALGGDRVRVFTLLATVALVAVSLLPVSMGLAGSLYLGGALVLGSLLLVTALRFGEGAIRSRAIGLIVASLFYLPALLAILALEAKVTG